MRSTFIDKGRPGCTVSSVAAVLFILSFLSFEYYGFVIVFCNRLIDISTPLAVFILIETNVFVILLIWAYIKVIFTGPGYLPKNINSNFPNASIIKARIQRMAKHKFGKIKADNPNDPQTNPESLGVETAQEFAQEDEKLKQIAQDPILQLTEMGYCFKCDAVKLPRSHHCKQCHRCVMRMDHHCPWVANCVGIRNHKFFLLFLIYAGILLLQIFLWELGFFHVNAYGFKDDMSVGDQLIVIINSATCIAVFLAVLALGGFQTIIATKNITTVEFHIKGISERNPFDKKKASKNLEMLFGVSRLEWFFPLDPKLPKEGEYHLLEELNNDLPL